MDSIPATQLHQSIGAIPLEGGGCRFCVWAPTHDHVSVDLIDQARIVPMEKVDGYHVAAVNDVAIGERYFYRLGDGAARPDPASRFQPDGVHGPSEVVSGQFDWHDQDWNGVAKEDLIIYEMHVGTFTDEGTFDAACERLDELVDLGITAVELMPLADSAGRWNWGYDGVCLFAPNRNFGNPDSLRRFVDAAHAKGLAVILDVVYNHLGPEGNYWSQFGPYLSTRHITPWALRPTLMIRSTAVRCGDSLSPAPCCGLMSITSTRYASMRSIACVTKAILTSPPNSPRPFIDGREKQDVRR